MANSVGYHESEDKLRPETQDRHRALTYSSTCFQTHPYNS